MVCPKTKVLFISGNTVDGISHHGSLEPGMHFFEKLFLANSLSKKVGDVLDASLHGCQFKEKLFPRGLLWGVRKGNPLVVGLWVDNSLDIDAG